VINVGRVCRFIHPNGLEANEVAVRFGSQADMCAANVCGRLFSRRRAGVLLPAFGRARHLNARELLDDLGPNICSAKTLRFSHKRNWNDNGCPR
jgi:hypothetical protein